MGVVLCVEVAWLLWHHRIIDEIQDGASKMASVLAPVGHQHGGCDYVDTLVEKWANRHSTEYDCQQLISFRCLFVSLSYFPFLSSIFPCFLSRYFCLFSFSVDACNCENCVSVVRTNCVNIFTFYLDICYLSFVCLFVYSLYIFRSHLPVLIFISVYPSFDCLLPFFKSVWLI